VRKYAEQLADSLEGRPIQRKAIAYPAVPVGLENGIRRQNTLDAAQDTGAYRSSVDAGVTELNRLLRVEARRTDPCAAITKIVLAGYSQGAQVVGKTIEQNKIPAVMSSRIADIVLFGDPKFDSDLNKVTPRSSFHFENDGVLGARPSGSFDNLSSDTRVLSFCREFDRICQGSPWLGTTHGEYPKAESHWAAWMTVDRLGVTTINRSWSPLPSAKLVKKADGLFYVKLTCQIPAGGVCHTRADVAYVTSFGTQHAVVRYVGRANADGIETGVVQLTANPGEQFKVRSAQADVTTTGIARGFEEKTAGISMILKD
jgi:hypothetical protein